MANFEGARVKLARASRHLDELQASVQAFLSTGNLTLENSDDENGDEVTRIRFKSAIPSDWSAIAGDAIHNLRSALDHLVWDLVVLNGGVGSRGTAFPVARQGSNVAAFDGLLARSVAGASPRAMRFIRRLKPHPGGNPVLLSLHELDVTDKHRFLLAVGAASPGDTIVFRGAVVVTVPPPTSVVFPLKDGDEVARTHALGRASFAEVERTGLLKRAVQIHIVFGSDTGVDGRRIDDVLPAAFKHVQAIVDCAERLFSARP